MASRSSRIWAALERFRVSKWGVVLYYGYVVGILVAAFIAVFAIRGNHDLAAKANSAAMQAKSASAVALRSLCFQKRGAIAQLDAARQFLREHPNGTADFSRALILNAIHNDEVDVAALRDVHCRAVPR